MAFPTNRDVSYAIEDVRNTLSRVSIDTYYQAIFPFGKIGTWSRGTDLTTQLFKNSGLGIQEKLSILCVGAELPGTQYQTAAVFGNRQGIREEFPYIRAFPPLNLQFYVDSDHMIIKLFETWMTYINPVNTTSKVSNVYSRFKYPEDYKEVIQVTKFERDTVNDSSLNRSDLLTYEFVNAWPTNITSMPVQYGNSDVLQISVQFSYDRYQTSFTPASTFANGVVSNTASDTFTSFDITNRFQFGVDPNITAFGPGSSLF